MKIDFYLGKNVLERKKKYWSSVFPGGQSGHLEGTKDWCWKQGFPTPNHQKFYSLGKTLQIMGRASTRFGSSVHWWALLQVILAPPLGLHSLEAPPKPTNLWCWRESEAQVQIPVMSQQGQAAKLTFSRWLTTPKHLVINFSTGILTFFGFKIF